MRADTVHWSPSCGYGHPRLNGGFYVWRKSQSVRLESGETEMPLRLGLVWSVLSVEAGAVLEVSHVAILFSAGNMDPIASEASVAGFVKACLNGAQHIAYHTSRQLPPPDLGDRIQTLTVLSKVNAMIFGSDFQQGSASILLSCPKDTVEDWHVPDLPICYT